MTQSPAQKDQATVDEHYMARALTVARKGRFWASPNPHVGCVLVRDDAELATGFTQPPGGNHAEVEAIAAAGDARGATAYVTLEPCAHWGRTGPCADALIAAGVSRVVAAIEDPHPEVAGEGFARLRAAGIEVVVGVLAEEARAELRGFLLRMERGWGRVRVKLGCSLDGRTAMASGESQWITGPEARRDVQGLRALSSVILTGSGTVLADDCALTVRADELDLSGDDLERATASQPLRAVLDSQGRVPTHARIFGEGGDTLVFHGEGVSAVAGTPVELALVDQQLPLQAVLEHLGTLGANEILVEAGPTLSGALLCAGLVDELVLYQAPVLLGSTARPLTSMAVEHLAEGIRLKYRDISRIGADLRITATIENQE